MKAARNEQSCERDYGPAQKALKKQKKEEKFSNYVSE